MEMMMAIAIGVVVIVIPVGSAATIDTAIRTRCHCRHVWAPIGGVVVAPPLLPSGAKDPMAAALTTTRNGTGLGFILCGSLFDIFFLLWYVFYSQ